MWTENTYALVEDSTWRVALPKHHELWLAKAPCAGIHHPRSPACSDATQWPLASNYAAWSLPSLEDTRWQWQLDQHSLLRVFSTNGMGTRKTRTDAKTLDWIQWKNYSHGWTVNPWCSGGSSLCTHAFLGRNVLFTLECDFGTSLDTCDYYSHLNLLLEDQDPNLLLGDWYLRRATCYPTMSTFIDE